MSGRARGAAAGGPVDFRPEAAHARALDAADPLARLRARFLLPRGAGGRPAIYFAGNSLGLQPDRAARAVEAELDAWARLGVAAHFSGDAPWYSYHEQVREPLARLVGARPEEVVAMNGLTVNLHLMLVSFYRPTASRYRILMEDCAFPSDTYAVRTHLAHRGQNPDDALLVARSTRGGPLDVPELEALLEREGETVALLLLGGVNYYTGQLFDIARLTALAHERGCLVGWDLAHAAGNVPLALHDWGVDFAVWCSYKYLNAGPGAVAGCFVHARHATDVELPRLGGWWGNDPERRFRMHLEGEFRPRPSADGWQLSNPPVLALAPLRASLALFDEAGMPALREKSLRLTGYLEAWIDHVAAGRIELLTPRGRQERGCQLSLRVLDRPRDLFGALERQGVVADFREPDVVRVAPVPLYNSFEDVWHFGQALAAWVRAR